MGRNYALTVPEIRQAAYMYRDRGMSRREIAAEFGVSDRTVSNNLQRAGVRMRTRLDGLRLAAVKAAAIKPPHHEIGRWNWLHPENADRWTTGVSA